MTQTNSGSEEANILKRTPELTAEVLDNMPAKEVPDKRQRFSKVFSLEGGNYQAITYAKPVHFQNTQTDTWEEIDNTFIPGIYEGKDCLHNRAGEVQVFCTESGEQPFLHLQDASDHRVSYGVEGAAKVFPLADINEVTQDASEKVLFLREKVLEKTEGTIRYAGIFPDVDMICTASANGLKDTMLFQTPMAAREIVFLFDVPGGQMESDPEKETILVSDDKGESLFFLPMPFLMDAAGEKGGVQVELMQEAGIWRMRCIPDLEFLKTAAFPVALDPAVYTKNQATNIQDTYVKSSEPDATRHDYPELWVCDNTTYGIRHSYLKVDSLPPVKAANYITKSYLCLSLYTRPEQNTAVFLSEVTSPFVASTLTYNNRPTNNSLYQDYIFTSTTVPISSYYQFDVTSLVRKWYLGANYGVVLTPQPEGPNTVRFHSMEGTRPPYLVVNYNSMAGLEGFLTYDERSFGRAGTSHVSLYNGNLIFTHSDTAENGNLMPVSIGHVYNSCDAQEDYWRMGYGWRTSMHLTLHRETIPDQTGTNITYYVYTDGDGTLHHFKNNGTGTYEDLDGLSLKLTLNTGAQTATMTDKGNNSTVFGLPLADRTTANFATETKMVRQIIDAQNNTVNVSATGLRIDTVTDGAGRVTTFGYVNNRCSFIQAPDRTDTDRVRFYYDASGNLTTITHEDNVNSTYTYNTNHLLKTAANADGRVITYTFANEGSAPSFGRPYRVTEFSITNGTATDERRSYSYGSRQTVSKNLTYTGGKSLTYHFNDYGNLVSVHDELGQASFTSFSEGGLPNHPDSVSRMQRVVTNLLTDHSIEDASPAWVTGGTGTFLRDQTVYHMGLVSRKITITAGNEAYCKQNVTLSPGKGYTFSAYVKTTGSVRAFLRVQYTEGTLKTVDSEPFYSLSEFTRISLSFTLPATASSTVTCSLMCNTNAGTAWFDCIQLEAGLTLNRYNLLQNSDFALGGSAILPTGWEKDSTSSDSFYSTARPADQPGFLTGRSAQLEGKYNRSVGIWQELRAYGNAGDVYVAGGWTRGFGKEVKTIPDRTIRNYINVQFLCGSNWVSGGKIYFNYEDGNWQFACGAVVAPYNYTYIQFEIQYFQQMNYADFTNMFLYREEFGNTFTYDAAGNIQNVSTLTGTKSNAVYDAFNNLTSYVQPGRPDTVKTVLEYGTTDTDKKKHLVKKATDPMGVIQTFTYDTKGNQTSAQTQNSALTYFIKGTTAYTANQNYVYSQTDARGKTVTSNIDLTKGTLDSVTDPNSQTVSYTYDTLKRVTATTASEGEKTYKNEYVYSQERLSQVKHNTGSNDTCDVAYNFTYDAFGKPVSVAVGTQNLSTNTYHATKGTLSSVTYGNGDSVTYIRDDFHRVTGIRYDGAGTDRFTYAYNAEGGIGHVKDTILGRTHSMEYDVAGRLMRVTARDSSSHIHTGELAYDTYNNLSSFKEKVGSGFTPYETTYAYDNGNRPTTVQFGSTSNKVGYGYDSLGRVSTRTLTVGGGSYASAYVFKSGGYGTGSTTALVSTITQTLAGQNFAYTYDNVGNISTETRNGYSTSYAYDNLGQLVRVNDQRAGTTWTYEYDRGGNILNKKRYDYTTDVLGTELETILYEYDADWKDKLASYNGASITYDEIGNPEADGTWTYDWQAGRQLASMAGIGATVNFAYNADGLRIRKTVVDGAVTEYTLHGKQVVHLKQGSNNLHFFYDAQGRPAIVDFNGTKYGYVHNLQGDIVAIVDGSGNQVVEYTYDAWGEELTKTGTMADTLGYLNPFRYRGYVFDEETGLYYLRSRYYNPVWGRFLNADSVLGDFGRLLSHNIYTYCYNNPAILSDDSGFVPSYSTLESDTGFDGCQPPGYWDWVRNHRKWEKEKQERIAKINQFFKQMSEFLWQAEMAKVELANYEMNLLGQAVTAIWNWTKQAVHDAGNWISKNWKTCLDWVSGIGSFLTTGTGILATAGVISIPVVGQVVMGVAGLVLTGWGIGRLAQWW